MSYYLMTNPGYMLGTILVGIAMVFSLYCQAKIKSTYAKYRRKLNSRGITGEQVAREILDSHGMTHVPVYEVKGELSDHFDPSNNSVSLSSDIYHGTTIAACAVAAHECGHAIQYHENYMPIRVRNAIIPLCNVGNYLGWIAIMIGLALGSTRLAFLGFFLMCGILAFQIITLPVEINASKRGLAILQALYLNENEYAGAWQMLYAAALTYVAGVCATLASMLRILFMILSSSNRDSN